METLRVNIVDVLTLILYLTACLVDVKGFLNIEEINSINYAIDILNKPVLSGQVASGTVMYLKSRFGQEYQCNLPEISLMGDDRPSDDSSSFAVENDIAELLRPLENAPCLIKMKDWWTYEFCYGKYIRQYHVEENEISGPEILLGQYESEYDWKNISEYDENNRNRLQRYHSQYYVNGTKCDVTGTLRRAEVRFLCEEGSGNYIARVDEPESCRYVLTVHTSHVCHHPFLRPSPSNKPQSVTCNPVLTAEQYEEYLIQEDEAKKTAEESRRRWLERQEEHLKEIKKKKNESDKDNIENEQNKSSEDDDSISTDNESADDSDLKVNIKFVSKSNALDKNAEENTVESTPKETADEEPDAAESQLMQDLAKELDEVSKDDPVELAGLKSKLKRSLEEQFSDIIEEAEEELNQNLDDNDKDLAFNQLASTLNKILKELDQAEQDLTQASKTLEKVQQEIDSQSQLEKVKVATDKAVENTEEETGKDVSGQRKIKILQEKEVDESQRQHLEQAIRQKLEQSGLDTRGKRIELKIVTAEYVGKGSDDVNSDGDDYPVISEEESKQFQNLIITILAGNLEAAEQVERQQRLEENYRFVWGKKQRLNQENNED